MYTLLLINQIIFMLLLFEQYSNCSKTDVELRMFDWKYIITEICIVTLNSCVFRSSFKQTTKVPVKGKLHRAFVRKNKPKFGMLMVWPPCIVTCSLRGETLNYVTVATDDF